MRESLKFFLSNKPSGLLEAAELGVMAGNNAKIILDNLKPFKLNLIDSWSTSYRPEMHDKLLETVKRFEGDSRVCIIKENSLVAARLFLNESLDYVYLDDSHAYEHVLLEIKEWFPKITIGGMLAGHDINLNYPERVLAAVQDFCQDTGLQYFTKKNENEEVGDWWIWKK